MAEAPRPEPAPETAHLTCTDGLEVDLLARGAGIQALRVPAGDARIDVVLGYPDPDDYRDNPYYLGSTVGRYANRIAGGRFELAGQRVDVATQDTGHCLHGGPQGFSFRDWVRRDADDPGSVTFECYSPDGDQGFPGGLTTTATYSLDDNRLIIRLGAISEADTVVNLTNHAYFNLAGVGRIDDHIVMINADHYTPVDDEGIPTGEIRAVERTPCDLREGESLSARLRRAGRGFDHNFVLNKRDVPQIRVEDRIAALAASVWSPISGIRLNVYTTQPGMQFYTGQGLGEPFSPYQGLCLEAQAFPDSPNHPDFPSTVLRQGERYAEVIVYEFEVEESPTPSVSV